MRFSFISKLFKTKLAMKIWLYLTLMVLSFILLIGLFLELYLRQYVVNNERNAAIRNTSHAAVAVSSEYVNIIEHFVTYTASRDFYDILVDIQKSTSDEYLENSTNLQSYLSQYSDISSLISAAMITTKDNRLFHSYKFKLKDENMSYTLDYDLENATPICMFPSTSSPFRNQTNVIAITFLLKTRAQDKLTLLADDIEDADVILYFFLNTEKVNNYMKLYYNKDSSGYLYLADKEGRPITYSNSNNIYQSVFDVAITDKVKTLSATDKAYTEVNNNCVIVHPIDNSDLYLVNMVSQSELLSKIRQLDLFLFYIVMVIFLFIPLIGFLVSIFVTKPLKKLMTSVKEIEDNTYTSSPNISKSDEIGQLSLSIDSMHQTIQQQFIRIKEEEREHFKMEIRLLSEQINPHFLYNTLECINMEIYNRHNENASSMIQSLGEYLRISLSYGNDRLPLQLELDQVKAYIRIMNYRFQHSIQLTLNIDYELLPMLILKSIFQPLVENSIKHGFSIDSSNYFPISPLIDILAFREPNFLMIVITDNGAGIDIERAEKIMKQEGVYATKNHHIGLSNIYRRLNSFYGDVDISFSSIPFYENKVFIKIPYQNFVESQDDNN